MITPQFSVGQDEEFVVVTMKVKYIRAQNCEIDIDNEDFKFFCKPYILKLHFPHPLIEDGREHASYDVDKGELIVKLPKQEKGLFFPHLDMLNTLIANKPKHSDKMTDRPSIQIVDKNNNTFELQEDSDGEIDWSIEPTNDAEQKPLDSSELLGKVKYGFNDQFYDFFSHIQESLSEVIENPNPDKIIVAERRRMRLEMEDDKFDPEHYMGDFILDREIKAAIEYVPIWYQQLKKKKDLMMQADLNKLSIENTQEIIDKIRAEESSNGNNESNNNTNASKNNEKPSEPVVETLQKVEQTTEAEDPTLPPLVAPTINTNQLQSINPNDLFSISIVKAPPAPTVEATTNSSDTASSNVNTIQLTQQKIEEESVPITDREKELLISLPKREYIIEDERPIFLGLIDLLYCYAYNVRTTFGDNTVESAWTIARLSPTLSWFDKFSTPAEVIQACMRRALCYPLFRHFELAKKVVQDVVTILKLGKRSILKSLLDMKYILDRNEIFHSMSRLYIDHYCLWIQRISKKKVAALKRELKKVVVSKNNFADWDLVGCEEIANEERENIMQYADQ
jgi:protein SHQ1